jgi:hypothetical protein
VQAAAASPQAIWFYVEAFGVRRVVLPRVLTVAEIAAIAECLEAVFPAIPYGIDLIGGPRLETDPAVCKAFRPGSR